MLSYESTSEVIAPAKSGFAPQERMQSPWAATLLRRLLVSRSEAISTADLGKSALVFSPHPDDECLGCGGTIVRMKQAGGVVKLVHMTDGSGSHPELIAPQDLKVIRNDEARSAAGALGIDAVFFLDFRDSHLWEQIAPAVDRVVEILRSEEPDQIFVPYRLEPWRQAADHLATTQIVLAALRVYAKPVVIWQYPVWFWLQWPTVGLRGGCSGIKAQHVFKNSVKLRFGLRALQDLRYSVDIAGVLDKKLGALAEHQSQLTRLVPDRNWTTLSDVANGQFLSNFQVGHEFFHRSFFTGNDVKAEV